MNFITFSLHEYNSYLLILLAAIFENGSSCYFIVWNTGKKKTNSLLRNPLNPFMHGIAGIVRMDLHVPSKL